MSTITVNKGEDFDIYGEALRQAVGRIMANNISVIDNGEDGSIRFLTDIFSGRGSLKSINLSRTKNI